MHWLPTLLAIFHYLAAFALVACLVTEWLVFEQHLPAQSARTLQRVDIGYGLAALVLLVVGILRVFYGGKMHTFYLNNGFFWVKMAFIFVAGLLSIYPTVRYLRWGNINDSGISLSDAEYRGIAVLLRIQTALLVAVIIVAPAMARGLWFF